jgi:hypothetical protein
MKKISLSKIYKQGYKRQKAREPTGIGDCDNCSHTLPDNGIKFYTCGKGNFCLRGNLTECNDYQPKPHKTPWELEKITAWELFMKRPLLYTKYFSQLGYGIMFKDNKKTTIAAIVGIIALLLKAFGYEIPIELQDKAIDAVDIIWGLALAIAGLFAADSKKEEKDGE